MDAIIPQIQEVHENQWGSGFKFGDFLYRKIMGINTKLFKCRGYGSTTILGTHYFLMGLSGKDTNNPYLGGKQFHSVVLLQYHCNGCVFNQTILLPPSQGNCNAGDLDLRPARVGLVITT